MPLYNLGNQGILRGYSIKTQELIVLEAEGLITL